MSAVQQNEVCPNCNSEDTECIDGRLGWICFKCRGRFSLAEATGFTPQKIFLSYAHMVDGNDDETALLVDAIQRVLQANGHDAWIDKEQLKPGADWRQGITEGIVSSDRVLAFLSPRSVRDPGVCLDEIGIAMGVKHGAIATLLADKRVENCSPASVTHIQYLDMTDWKGVMAQGESVWEPWLAEKTRHILDIIAKNTGFAGEIEKLAKVLQPLPTSSKIGTLTARGFVGRQWVMHAINDWRLNNLEQKLFWLKAGPGMGKSSIAAHLAHFAKTQTVAVHFCEYNVPESRSATRFIQNLAFLLAARLPDYRRLLTYQLDILDKPLAHLNADELLRRLVLEPLRNRIDGGEREDRLLVVVDALDEADADLPALLAKYIPEFPAWLGIVVTSRPETADVLAQFKPMELGVDDARNWNDLMAFLDEWQRQQPSAVLNSIVRQTLLDASEGNILYLVYAKDGFQSGLLDLTQPRTFPKGIASLYRQWLERQFGAHPHTNPQWMQHSYPLLELVCASPLPLPIWLASRLLNWQGQDRLAAVMPLGSLLEIQHDLTLRMCHRSLSEWLQDPTTSGNPFWINTAEARIKLARSLLDELPAALSEVNAGYVHLALPDLLQVIPVSTRKQQLWPHDWSEVTEQLDKLDKFLASAQSKEAYLRHVELRKLKVADSSLVLGERHPETLATMNNLARTLSADGQLAAARALQEQALTLLREVLGERHPNTLTCMSNLSATLSSMGDLMSARLLQEQALELRREILGDAHPDTLVSMNNLAKTLSSKGDLAAARILQEQALLLHREVLGERHPDTLRCMSNLAGALSSQGDLIGARALEEQVLALRREVLGGRHPDTLFSINCLANTLSSQGAMTAARFLQEEAVALQREVLGERHPDTITSLGNLATSMFEQGDLPAAQAIMERVLTLRREVLGERHPHTFSSMNNLAVTLAAQNDLTAGGVMLAQVLALQREVLGERHPDTLLSMSNLAYQLLRKGDLTSAYSLNKQVLELRGDVLGQRHPDTLASMNNLAHTHFAQGDLTAARVLQDQVLALQLEVLGDHHPNTLTSMNNLARTLFLQGDFAAARVLQEQALAMGNEVLGERHPKTLSGMSDLAATLYSQGELAAARVMQEQVLALHSEVLGNLHPDTLKCMNVLLDTLVAQDDLNAQGALLGQVLAMQREALGESHPVTITVMNVLAATLSSQGDLIAACELQEQALTLQREVLGERHPDTLTSMSNLAATLSSTGDLMSARVLLERVLVLQNEDLGDRHPDTIISMNALAVTLSSQGDLIAACELQEQALTLQREVLGERHPDTLTSMSNFAHMLFSQGDLTAARVLLERVLVLQREDLGDRHPDTIISMYALACTLNSQGDLVGAGVLEQQILAFRSTEEQG